MKPLIAAIPVLIATAALAAPPAQFEGMDANRDGRISAREHAAAAKKMFQAMDANRDGKVTAAEMSAAQKKVTGKKAQPGAMSSADKIKVVDKDGDGILSADEHEEGAKAMFSKMDADRDDFLSRDEFNAGHVPLTKSARK
jgi:hypothetical protein